MEVVVNIKYALDVKAGVQLVLKDQALIFALLWFHRNSHLWNSATPQWIQFLEQGMSGHQHLFQNVQCERQLGTTSFSIIMPCCDVEVKMCQVSPAFHNLQHVAEQCGKDLLL